MADRLLQSILRAGAKASKIAKLCRAENSLFSLIVQEKQKLKNKKVDFKTLADVFIQQVVKSEISSEFHSLSERIYGEENNEFTNAIGENVVVEMGEDESGTMKMLCRAFNGNIAIAKQLSNSAHSEINYLEVDAADLSELADYKFSIDEVGIWIDPIDCTSQFVAGIEDATTTERDVYSRGLQCVTVLIGAYDTATGTPIMGVIYQPFHSKIDGEWKSKCYWGTCFEGCRLNNINHASQVNIDLKSQSPRVVTSSSDEIAMGALKGRMEVCIGSGAGYKCLCVINGLVDLHVYYLDACHAWDTCAPHAILLSLGGGMACLKKALEGTDVSRCQLRYNEANNPSHPPWANIGGILAYSGSDRSNASVKLLQEMMFVLNTSA